MANLLKNTVKNNTSEIRNLVNQHEIKETGAGLEDFHKLELHSFKNLWLQDALLEERSHLPDIDFITSDKCIVKAHRSILCIFSSMVREMMGRVPCCQSIAILLPDCTSKALVHVLNMISTGESLQDPSEAFKDLSENELKEVEEAATVLGIHIDVVSRIEKWNNHDKSDPSNDSSDDEVEILDVVAVVNKVNDVLTNPSDVSEYTVSNPMESEVEETLVSDNSHDFQSAMEKVLLKQRMRKGIRPKKLKDLEDMNLDSSDDLMDKIANKIRVLENLEKDIQSDHLATENYDNFNLESNIQSDQLAIETNGNFNLENDMQSEQLAIETQSNINLENDIPNKHLAIETHGNFNLENDIQKEQLAIETYGINTNMKSDIQSDQAVETHDNLKNDKSSNSLSEKNEDSLVKGEENKIPEDIQNVPKDTNNISNINNAMDDTKSENLSILDNNMEDLIKKCENDATNQLSSENLNSEKETKTSEINPSIKEAEITRNFMCQICTNGRNFELPNQLIQHYVFHFKKELKDKFFHHFTKSLCLLCSKNIRNENKFAHIGATHKKVNEILLQKGLKQVTSLKQGAKPQKNKPEESKAEPISTEIKTENAFVIGKTCQICNKGFRNNFQTVDHLSKIHFQAEILRKYAKNGNVCTFCGVDAIIPARLASHLGYSHRKIDQFIENSYSEKDENSFSEKDRINVVPKNDKAENNCDDNDLGQGPDNSSLENIQEKKPTIKVKKEEPTSEHVEKAKLKRTGCNKCENCMKKDCRSCINCRDMKKYGGPAEIRKKCKQKKCLNPSIPTPRPEIPRILSEPVKTISELPKPEIPRIISEPKNVQGSFKSRETLIKSRSMTANHNKDTDEVSVDVKKIVPEREKLNAKPESKDWTKLASEVLPMFEPDLTANLINNPGSEITVGINPNQAEAKIEETSQVMEQSNPVIKTENPTETNLKENTNSNSEPNPENLQNPSPMVNEKKDIDDIIEKVPQVSSSDPEVQQSQNNLNNLKIIKINSATTPNNEQKVTTSENKSSLQFAEQLSPETLETQEPTKSKETSELRPATDPQFDTKKNDLDCFVCDRSFSSQTDLYRHYSLKHYFEQICEKYPQQPFCPVPDCNAKTKQRMAWVRHLGQVHEIVQDFLPEQFWIEREEVMPKVKTEPLDENVESEQVLLENMKPRDIVDADYAQKVGNDNLEEAPESEQFGVVIGQKISEINEEPSLETNGEMTGFPQENVKETKEVLSDPISRAGKRKFDENYESKEKIEEAKTETVIETKTKKTRDIYGELSRVKIEHSEETKSEKVSSTIKINKRKSIASNQRVTRRKSKDFKYPE